MISKFITEFCDEYWKIENYDKAINDDKTVWHCHHRLEVQEDGTILSRADLQNMNLYLKRPPEELIFLTPKEHSSLHANNMSEQQHKHLSIACSGELNGMYGKPGANLGKHFTYEHKRKIAKRKFKKILYNGIIYDSHGDCANANNISPSYVTKLIKAGIAKDIN